MTTFRPGFAARFTPIAAALVLAFASAAFAADEVNTDRTGLAIVGYDPVAYFTDGEPTKGDFQTTAEHDGAVYRFVSEENRARFLESPDRYVPQFGGYCAYGVAVGAKFSADPTVWKIVDDKLYLNLDENIAAKFNEDADGYIAKAESTWKELHDAPAR